MFLSDNFSHSGFDHLIGSYWFKMCLYKRFSFIWCFIKGMFSFQFWGDFFSRSSIMTTTEGKTSDTNEGHIHNTLFISLLKSWLSKLERLSLASLSSLL